MFDPVDTQLNCPSCGAGIDVNYRHTLRVVCPYCGQTNVLNAEQQLSPNGPKQLPLVDYGSPLRVGAVGKLDGQDFKVMGRLRFEYPDGFWDEWLLRMGSDRTKRYWLHEDEGDFILYQPIQLAADQWPFAKYEVGEFAPIGGMRVFITEKRKAKLQGAEGEIPFDVVAGSQAHFVDGIEGGRIVSVEFYADGSAEGSLGNLVDPRKLSVGSPATGRP